METPGSYVERLAQERCGGVKKAPELSAERSAEIQTIIGKINENPLRIVGLDTDTLKSMIGELSDQCVTRTGGRSRSPEEWAAEFLYLSMPDINSMEDLLVYLSQVHKTAYSKNGLDYYLLMIYSAALALQLKKADPNYAVPGSARAAFRNYLPGDQQLYLEEMSRFFTIPIKKLSEIFTPKEE